MLGSKHLGAAPAPIGPTRFTILDKGPEGSQVRYLVKEPSVDNTRGGAVCTYTHSVDGIKGSNGGRMSLNSFQVITDLPDKMMDLASSGLLNQFSTFIMGK